MKRLTMLLVAGILLVPAVGWAVVDGFDYPIGKPNGNGYYNCQDFLEEVTITCEHISWNGTHLGEDWNRGSGSDDCGDDVFAAADGTIVYAQNNVSGWGRVLIIRHTLTDGSQVETLYGHLASFTKTSGSFVRGEKVGTIGDGGGLYPCHLHFELRFSNCREWGAPGPGYSSNHTGWTDPSDYIDAHRSVTPAFAASKTGQNISVTPWLPANGTYTLWVDYRNVGTTTWENFGGVTNPEYIELRSLTGAVPCELVNGCAYDASWTNPQRIETFVTVPPGGTTVPNGATARFQFVARSASSTGECVQWVAPWVSGGTCIDGWGGVNFTIRTDATFPQGALAVGAPPPGTYTTDITIGFVVNDAHSGGRGYAVGWDNPSIGGPEVPGTSGSTTLAAQGVGSHTLYLRVWDQVGNTDVSNLGTYNYQPGPCPGREISHSPCMQPGDPCIGPASAILPDLKMSLWQSVGQPAREILQPGQTYSIGFEYTTPGQTDIKLGLGNDQAPELGVVINQASLPAGNGDWRPFWSAPFTVTDDQVRDFPNLRLLTSNTAGIEIRNVRILSPQP